MSRQITTNRASRNRRLVAIAIWTCLSVVAMVFWNSRTQGIPLANPSEPQAFLLAAFTTFVSLFAWMLFNPARGVSAETAILMLAGTATLLPPCVIAFCTMPPDSALRGWLTFGLFLLLVIAVMSPVPEEFFGVPRSRLSYLQPVSLVNLQNESVIVLHADWLRSTDLSESVAESSRPSLAPSSWQEDRVGPPDLERPARSRRRERAAARNRKPDTTAQPAPVADETESAVTSPQERRRLFGWRRKKTTEASPDVVAEEKTNTTAPRHESTAEHRRRTSTRSVPTAEPDTSRPPAARRRDAVVPPSPKPAHRSTDRPVQQPSTERVIPSAPLIPPPVPQPDTDLPDVAAMLDEIQVADNRQQTDFDRVRDDQGGEMIEGTVLLKFARGQKRANVHVPFSPPLPGTPDVECTAVDNDSLRLRVPECRAWGIRIEGRRSDAGQPEETSIAFSAVHVTPS